MNCGTCTHYKINDDAMAKHGYHNCKQSEPWKYLGKGAACQFSPSRWTATSKLQERAKKIDKSSGDAMLDLFS